MSGPYPIAVGAQLSADNRTRLDALGREVPEWAREAFDVLAEDGRRVAVLTEVREDELWANDRRANDSCIVRSDAAGLHGVQVRAGETGMCYPLVHGTWADAARRALAMEAERLHPQQTVKLPPMDEAKRAEVIDALRALSSDWHAPIAPRRHNATCPRCYGPAFHGWGYAPKCEREGGCLADAVPSSVRTYHVDRNKRSWLSANPGDGMPPRETAYRAVSGDDEGPLMPTRDLAVTAWREAVLSRAVEEAVREGRIRARPEARYFAWRRGGR